MNNIQKSKKYDDIINLNRHISKKHPPMSLYARSAQFAPFAALTGYEDAVRETARRTTSKIELDDDLKLIIDSKLQFLRENINKKQEITFTYFIQDDRKEGGEYVTTIGIIKSFDELNQMIFLTNKTQIPINNIIEIKGLENKLMP